MKDDRYLISVTAGGFDFHAYLICPPGRANALTRAYISLIIDEIEKALAPGSFWAPIALVTKLKTGRKVEKLLFKNCPETEAKMAALKTRDDDCGAMWIAQAADPDNIALMELH